MADIGVFEAKARLSELIDGVVAGREVTITRHGKPVARLVSAHGAPRKGRRAVVDEIKRFRATLKTGRVNLRALIEQGRR
jgi:prevent-host-death family protein